MNNRELTQADEIHLFGAAVADAAPQAPKVDEARAAHFWATYERNLIACAERGLYRWPVANAPEIAKRMREAWMVTRSGSKDGPAFAATCKALGIKCTYKAIRSFWEIAQ